MPRPDTKAIVLVPELFAPRFHMAIETFIYAPDKEETMDGLIADATTARPRLTKVTERKYDLPSCGKKLAVIIYKDDPPETRPRNDLTENWQEETA